MKQLVLLTSAVLFLGGCATRYCERDALVYQNAVERAPLQSPEGLQVPEPDPNFEIPEASGEDVQYATPEPNASGRVNTRCLDTPPRLAVAAPTVDDAALEPETESQSEIETEGEPESAPAQQGEEPNEEATDEEPVQL